VILLDDMRLPDVRALRTIGPFLIGAIGVVVVQALGRPIGEAMGWYDPLFGYWQAEARLGAPLGLLAALVARRWRDVLYLLAGFAIGGGITWGLAGSGGSNPLLAVTLGALWTPFLMGIFAVPVYLVTYAVIDIVKGRRAGPPA
jgi:4-hydroxybenzoate polyprenyltransferase